MHSTQASGSEPLWHEPGSGQLRELLLAGLVDRLPAAIYVAESGADGQWIYASPQIEEILGFGAEDFIADPELWARQLHPADRDWVLQSDLKLADGGRDRAEYRMIRSDGQVVWVLDDALLGEIAPHGYVQHGLLYDITARKRTEMLLAEHADILERVARGDDLTLTLIELARSTEAVSGAGRCVIEVQPTSGLDCPVLTASGGELTVAERDQLGPAGSEAEFGAATGELLGRVSLHYPAGSVAQQQDEDLAGWAAGLASVAVLRAAEHARVALSMSLLQATLESTADGILVMEASGRIISYNQKFIEMWQIDPAVLATGSDELLRASVLDQLVDPDWFSQQVDHLIASPTESSHDEIEFLDGRVFARYSQPQRVDGVSVGRVWSFRDMTLRRQLEQELRAQAFTDPLTPLANRTYFLQQMTAALASGASGLAVLLLDLDDFKTVNDSLGHVVGDGLLIAVAERLKSCLRAGDVAARLGGDEFVVLLSSLHDSKDAICVAERMLAALSQPLVVDGQSLTIRASVGIAAAAEGESATDLLRNADLAMYTAKRDGGGRYHRYARSMHADAMARLALKADLERAIDNGELIVHYQPVLELASFRIASVEALVRWQHPERGVISPAEFIALAEESRLIDRLGSSVLRQACVQVSYWRRTIAAHRNLTVSVNVSPRQLSDPNLIAEVRQALQVADLPAEALILEITESSLATPNVDVVTVLKQLKNIGVALALDDFGVGYSSLGHLVNFPLDIVKIDKSFIERINTVRSDTDRTVAAHLGAEQTAAGGAESSTGAVLLRAVLQVADALSLKATIEGIEDESQLREVKALGCSHAQGYLLSPPLAAAAAGQLLAGRHPLQVHGGLPGDNASMTGVQIRDVGYDHPDAQRLIAEVQAEYVERYGGPDDSPVDPREFAPPQGLFAVGYLADRPVVMGGWRRHAGADVDWEWARAAVEVKRMYVAVDARGRGFARAMLTYLEDNARRSGAQWLLLETGLRQPEALELYRSAGYQAVPAFGHYADTELSVHLGKPLVDGAAAAPRPADPTGTAVQR